MENYIRDPELTGIIPARIQKIPKRKEAPEPENSLGSTQASRGEGPSEEAASTFKSAAGPA